MRLLIDEMLERGSIIQWSIVGIIAIFLILIIIDVLVILLRKLLK